MRFLSRSAFSPEISEMLLFNHRPHSDKILTFFAANIITGIRMWRGSHPGGLLSGLLSSRVSSLVLCRHYL